MTDMHLCTDEAGNLFSCPMRPVLTVQGELSPRTLPLDGSLLAELVEVATTVLSLAVPEVELDDDERGLVLGSIMLANDAVAIARRAIGQALLVGLGSARVDPTDG